MVLVQLGGKKQWIKNFKYDQLNGKLYYVIMLKLFFKSLFFVNLINNKQIIIYIIRGGVYDII